jgi:hypothetical protein
LKFPNLRIQGTTRVFTRLRTMFAEQFGPIFYFGTVDTNMSFCEKFIHLTWTS